MLTRFCFNDVCKLCQWFIIESLPHGIKKQCKVMPTINQGHLTGYFSVLNFEGSEICLL